MQFTFECESDTTVYKGFWIKIIEGLEGKTPIEVDVTREWIEREWQARGGPASRPRPANDAGMRLCPFDTPWLRRAIRRPVTLLFIEKEAIKMIHNDDVSPALRYLVKALCQNSSHFAEDQAYLRKLCWIFWPPEPITITMNYDGFKKYGGYLHFLLQERHPSDEMEKWVENEQEWSIMSGLYIHPLSPSIIRHRDENRIAGLMMDTTWSVTRLYVTAILVAVSRNTSIPLAFAFGPAETTDLYAQFYESFQTQYQIDLGRFIVESDQGAALKAICREHGNPHRACLRHFLARLKHPYFSVYVADLVRARTNEEFQLLCKHYHPILKSVVSQSPELRTAADQTFKKAGLAFNNMAIYVADPVRWAEVSMLQRVPEQIPQPRIQSKV
jgi:hypothetical protein